MLPLRRSLSARRRAGVQQRVARDLTQPLESPGSAMAGQLVRKWRLSRTGARPRSCDAVAIVVLWPARPTRHEVAPQRLVQGRYPAWNIAARAAITRVVRVGIAVERQRGLRPQRHPGRQGVGQENPENGCSTPHEGDPLVSGRDALAAERRNAPFLIFERSESTASRQLAWPLRPADPATFRRLEKVRTRPSGSVGRGVIRWMQVEQ